jgi:uncharacterized surface anchored protein
MRALLFIAALTWSLSQSTAQTNNGIIEGAVVRYGTTTGIANVEISLLLEGANINRYFPEAVTDANGHFVLRNVVPGKYTLRAARGGYVNPVPDGVRLRDGGTTKAITLAPLQHIKDANLSMVQGGVIAGRIVDANGRVVVAGSVSAIPVAPSESRTISIETNDRGEYRIIGLEPGKYRVAHGAGGSPMASVSNPTNTRTYFPGTADPERAEILTVTEGEVLTAINLQIQPPEKTFRASGRLVSPNGGLADARIDTIYLFPKGARIPKAQADTVTGGMIATGKANRANRGDANEHHFEIEGVVSGSYDLFVPVGRRADYANCCDLMGRATLDVVGQDVTDMRIIVSGTAVRGSVVPVRGGSNPVVSVSLALVPEDVRTRQVKPDAAGAFEIPSVLRGTWKVLATGLDPSFALFDVRQGQKSIYDEGLVVDDRSPEAFQILISPAGAIQGLIRDAQQRPIAGAQIQLVPSAPNETNAALHRKVTSDAAGRFALASVAIGEYSVVTTEPAARTTTRVTAGATTSVELVANR